MGLPATKISEIEMIEEAECWVSPPMPQERPTRATIVIPTYSAAATLPRALRSAQDQTLRDIEIIVVDDASTDASWPLITGAMTADPRVRAVLNKRNRGKPVGMNCAIGLARGQWLAVLDADDWYHPERLGALVRMAEEWRVDMAADNQYFHDATAAQLTGTAWPTRRRDWELSFDDFLAGSNAYETFNLGMLKPVMSMDFIRRTALGYEELARHGQDFLHLLQFYLLGGRAVITDRPFYYYTQPFGAVSRQWSHSARKRYDFKTAHDINQRYLAAAATTLTRTQARKLEKRNARLAALEYFYQLRECLAERDMIGAMARLSAHPGMLGYAAKRLYGRYINRPSSKAIERIARRAFRNSAPPSPPIEDAPP